jgi:serine/threonine protein kinase
MFSSNDNHPDKQLLKISPNELWGYVDKELILAGISGIPDKVVYTWTRDEVEISKGVSKSVLSVNKPGSYCCSVSTADHVEISKAVVVKEATTATKKRCIEHSATPDITEPVGPNLSNEVPTIQPEELTYLLSDIVGTGGFGKVYKGTWVGTEVAIKIMMLPSRGRQQHSQFITNELKIHSRIRHPNIIQIMGVATTSSQIMIASEFVRGCDLEMAIFESEKQAILEGRKEMIAKQICQAIAYLHALQPPIVQQDIKLSNILIDSITYFVKLCDLGISRVKSLNNATVTSQGLPGTVM